MTKISEISFNGLFAIPEKIVERGELYRIELGISHGTMRESLSTLLKKECLKQKIATVDNLKNRIKLKYLFRPKLVEDYFEEQNISSTLSKDLINYCQSNALNKIKLSTRIKDLSEQEFRLLKFFVLLNQNEKIYIETGGMYLSVLCGTYQLLSNFLENGGIVIELAYPHFPEDDDLKWMATKNLATFKIGEMRIRK